MYTPFFQAYAGRASYIVPRITSFHRDPLRERVWDAKRITSTRLLPCSTRLVEAIIQTEVEQ